MPPLRAFHDRERDLSMVRCSRVTAAVLLMALTAGPAVAQVSPDASARAQRYLECPAAGVSIQFFTVPQAASSQDDRSPTFPPLVGPVEFWPGDAGWVQPEPVPDGVLSDSGSWLQPSSLIDRHEALRLRNDRPLPQGSPRILIFEHSNHWSAIESSVVAIRGADGAWRLDRLQEVNAGKARARPTAESGALSNDAGRRLDALLADRCLDAEPVNTEWSPLWSSTQSRWVVEIEGVGRPRRFAGAHAGFGRVGAIHHLLSRNLEEGI